MRFAVARALLPIVTVLAVAPRAAADDTSECIAASEAAQSLRDQHSLLEARDKLGVCSRNVCPGPIRLDCIQERVKVDVAMPSVVLRARDSRGDDDASVRVFCDGAPFATQLDGKALAVDPGPHTFRFEAEGYPAVEHRIVVGEGEKNRLLVAEFGETPAGDTPEPSAAPAPPPNGNRVGATVPMAVLWSSATGDIHQMRDTCAPSAGGAGCSSSRVDSDRTRLIVGDVFLGVAVAAIATGTVLVLVHPRDSKPDHDAALHLEAAPARGGAFVAASGQF